GGELRRRFATACERLAARTRERLPAGAARSPLEVLGRGAESLAGATPATASKTWKAFVGRGASRPAAPPPRPSLSPLARRFSTAEERLREHWREADRDRTALEAANVKRLDALCTRIEELAAAESCKPGAGRRELHAADAALGDLGPLPSTERRAAWIDRLSEARDRLLRRGAAGGGKGG